jgi:hypothetical protein
MPASEKSNRALARTSSSCSRPTAANTGVALPERDAGLALCAATQIKQDAESVWFGWLWVDSAATVHNIRDRQSHADHRTQTRIGFPLWVRLLRAYNGYPQRGNFRQVTIGRDAIGRSPSIRPYIP